MKKAVFSAVAIAVLCVLGCKIREHSGHMSSSNDSASVPRVASNTTTTSAHSTNSPNVNRDRLAALEALGEVPENADRKDFQLAQWTSWWGKKLDAKTFWKGRVLWCDDSARSAAQRHGRMWPPIPDTGVKLPPYPDDDGLKGGGEAPDGLTIAEAWSSAENAFWQKFNKEHPRPPEDIERHQLDMAGTVLRLQRMRDAGNSPIPVTDEMLSNTEQAERRVLIQKGYPPEAFSHDSWYWTYVLKQRATYQNLLDRGTAPDSPEVQWWLKSLLIRQELVTASLPPEQLRAATAWKLAYLGRLRRLGTNEMYVDAYLKTWNLSPEQVFGGNR